MKKNTKKYAKTSMVAAVAVGSIVVVAPVATQASTQFSDVKANDYFYGDVLQLAERGVIGGFSDGTFKPKQDVTRGQAAKIIAGVLGLDTTNVTNPGFKDVPTSHQYYGAIAALANAGIINGYEDSTFRPGAAVQRNHMAKIIAGAFNLEAPANSKTPLRDVRADYAQYVNALYSAGVTTGKTATTFDGSSNVTRGQLASFVIRAETTTAVVTKDVTFTISQVADNKVGEYKISTALKGLLNEANNAALEGAVVNATLLGDEIVGINSLQLNVAGAEGALVTLDGGNLTIAGDLVVNADYVKVKNITVQGNISLTNSVVNEFSADALINDGDFIVEDASGPVASVTPIFANTTKGPKIGFKNSNVKNVHVKRDNVALASDVKLPELTVSAKVSAIQVDADVAKVTVNVTVNIAISGAGSFDEVTLEKAVDVALGIIGSIAKLVVNNTDARVDVAASIKIGEVTLPANTTAAGIIKNYESIKSNINNVVTGNATTPPGSNGSGTGSGGSDSNSGIETTVTVTGVSAITDIAVVNKAYTLPTTVTVTLSNGKTDTKSVTWTAPEGITITGGKVTFTEYKKDAIFTGTVAGTPIKASLKLTAITEIEAITAENLILEAENLKNEINEKVAKADELIKQIKQAEEATSAAFNNNVRLASLTPVLANATVDVDTLKQQLANLLGEITTLTKKLENCVTGLGKLELTNEQKAKVEKATKAVTEAKNVETAAKAVGVDPAVTINAVNAIIGTDGKRITITASVANSKATKATVEFYKVENDVVASTPLADYTRNADIIDGKVDFSSSELPAGTYQVKVTVGSVSGVASEYVTVFSGDQTAPTLTVGLPSIGEGENVYFKSNEIGEVYLVHGSQSPTNKSELENLVSGNNAKKTSVSTANTDFKITTTNLAPGEYKIYAVDSAGNVSTPQVVTIINNVTDGVDVQAIKTNNKWEIQASVTNSEVPQGTQKIAMLSNRAYNLLSQFIEYELPNAVKQSLSTASSTGMTQDLSSYDNPDGSYNVFVLFFDANDKVIAYHYKSVLVGDLPAPTPGVDALAVAKDAASKLVAANYTAESYKAVTDAVAAADAATTDGEKLAAAKVITDAIAALVNAPSATPGADALAAAKDAASKLVVADYTAESYKAVTDAVAAADAATTDGEKLAAAKVITDAIAALVNAPSATPGADALAAAKDAASKLVAADYTAESYKAVTDAVAAADAATTDGEKLAAAKVITDAIAALVNAPSATPGADALAAAKDAASKLVAADYTAESYKEVTDAVAAADAATTDGEKLVAAKVITDAIAALVDKATPTTVLQAAKTAASGKQEADYTAASWTAFQGALTTALGLPETNDTEKADKTTAINDAIALLVSNVDGALTVAKTAASGKQEADYTAASWTAFQGALTTALGLPETNDTEKADKTTAINDAIALLVSNVDGALTAAKTAASGKQEADYTAASWTAFQGALTTALGLPETNDTEKADKTTAINDAIALLVFNVDGALTAAKTAASGKQEADYTAASWTAFQGALTTALGLPETNDTEKADKTTAINDAIALLVFNVNGALTAAKTAASGKQEADYTAASWTAFQGALTTALGLPETNDTEKADKTTAINDAIDLLVANIDGENSTVTLGTVAEGNVELSIVIKDDAGNLITTQPTYSVVVLSENEVDKLATVNGVVFNDKGIATTTITLEEGNYTGLKVLVNGVEIGTINVNVTISNP
ncbi:S-layer homology domain-containing protein [Solibacillus sp. FSL H8-0538]|uniref:S-layer homology domain-containing protein n=1 Tax=Solibacillus sp. FSL H8-0538 TaxID=2921400 RepID=UPI0030FBBFFE